MANTVKINNPHAAVVVWNYDERLGTADTHNVNAVNEIVISTVSLIGISTNKTKGQPVGNFELELAPTKNWVAALTPGSWLCVMMSQKPITKEDLPKHGFAKPDKVKMVGKIESVRVNTRANPETGARETTYSVIGIDWAYIFENFIYIDPFLDPKGNQIGSATFLELFKIMKGESGSPEIRTTDQLIQGILDIIGRPLSKSIEDVSKKVNRIAKSTFAFKIPRPMVKFLKMSKKGKQVNSNSVADLLNVFTGKLATYDDPTKNLRPYRRLGESSGYIDPVSFKGTNTLWQLLMDNSNPAVNEMFTGMRWNADGTMSLSLYNRIKPFVFRGSALTTSRIAKRLESETFQDDSSNSNVRRVSADVRNIISTFQNVRRFEIPLGDIISINAGTNWRDKYNFIEIKPSFQDFQVLGTWIKSVAQTADERAFAREGFRPLIVSTKQFPTASTGAIKEAKEGKNSLGVDLAFLAGWKELLRQWYFDTHKMLNGSVNFVGQNNHIEVGDNIMMDIRVIGPTPNINFITHRDKGKGIFIMAHVEGVSHEFRVDPESGARTFITNIQFVRGIITNKNGKVIGRGHLDNFNRSLPPRSDLNSQNVFGTSTMGDPDPQKLRGS